MSIMPRNLPNHTRTTYVVKSSEPINENLEVNGEIWYNNGWSFSSDDDRYTIKFFTVKYLSSTSSTREVNNSELCSLIKHLEGVNLDPDKEYVIEIREKNWVKK